MDTKCGNTVTLYAAQAAAVWEAIQRDGVAYSKAMYVQRKYGESAPIFLTAYQWFVQQLPRFVPKPEGAEFPYWAFGGLYQIESGAYPYILELEVPVEEAVFFDMQDWNKVVCLSYIGQDEADERRFRQELTERGLRADDVMLSNFYPDVKARIYESWQRLFRHHEKIKSGRTGDVKSVQAGLWCIKKEWIRAVNGRKVES